jgi:type VI secretion system protein ImpK
MREELARIVYPILNQGLNLKERVEMGDRPVLKDEQAVLTVMLKRDAEARQDVSFGGEGEEYLGARYALVCWLDELFSDETTEWGSRWSNSKLETQKYGTNDREFKFWDQADLAARRSDRDALEVFYLCVMLGFRGRWLDRPQELAEWRNAVEEQLNQEANQQWPGPAELPVRPANVPPLTAQNKLRRAILALLGVLGVAVLVIGFLTFKRLGGTGS